MDEPVDQTFSKTDWTGALRRVIHVLLMRSRLLLGVLAGNVRVGHALERSWRDRYDRARRDLWANEPAFLPSRQWTVITRFYRMVLRGHGLKGFKSTFGRFLTTYESDNPWLFEAVHHLYRSALAKRDVWGLLDTLEEPELGDGTYILYGGKRLSLDLLQSIDELYRLRETLGFERNDPVVFCEVGAGYGRLAETVLSAMPNATYLIFDLPESLLMAQYYLKTLHPDWKIALYPESEAVMGSKEALAGHRAVFGLPHQLRALPKGYVDAFVNVYSFMEMGREQIELYFQVIEDLDVGALYLKQHKREVNLFDQAVNAGRNYPLRPHWKTLCDETSVLFAHSFEAVYQLRPSRVQRPKAAS